MVATMRLRCYDFSLLGAVLGALLCILLVGCSRDTQASSIVKEAVGLEQTVNHMVIGRRDNGRLDYLDMTSNSAITTVSFSERQQVTATSVDLTKPTRTDLPTKNGRHIATRTQDAKSAK
jgi:hypothetical protein